MQIGLTTAIMAAANSSSPSMRRRSSKFWQLAERLRPVSAASPPQIEALLALRGVIDVSAPIEDEAKTALRDKAILKSAEEAFQALASMRSAEGAKLASVLGLHLDRIEKLVIAARDNPARSVEAMRARLAEQVARLMETNASFDRDRLHQEAVLLATRADIAEEIDRLFAHIGAARKLIAVRPSPPDVNSISSRRNSIAKRIRYAPRLPIAA